jgi:hypothetical protein
VLLSKIVNRERVCITSSKESLFDKTYQLKTAVKWSTINSGALCISCGNWGALHFRSGNTGALYISHRSKVYQLWWKYRIIVHQLWKYRNNLCQLWNTEALSSGYGNTAVDLTASGINKCFACKCCFNEDICINTNATKVLWQFWSSVNYWYDKAWPPFGLSLSRPLQPQSSSSSIRHLQNSSVITVRLGWIK